MEDSNCGGWGSLRTLVACGATCAGAGGTSDRGYVCGDRKSAHKRGLAVTDHHACFVFKILSLWTCGKIPIDASG